MKTGVVLGALAVWAISLGQLRAAPIVIPFRMVNDHIQIPVSIGGRPVEALLDSGSPVTELDIQRGASLGVHADLGASFAPGTQARPGEGYSGQKSISIGGWTSSEPVYLTDLSAVEQMGQDGVIIGADLFRAFVVEVDFDSRQVTLHERPEFKSPEGAFVLPVARRQFGYFSPLTFEGGTPIEANLDLGANASLTLNAATASRLGMSARAGSPRGCIGVVGEQSCKTGLAAARIGLGEITLRDVPLVLASPTDPVFANLPANLGLGVLGRFHLWMDFTGGKVWLKPNSHFSDPYRRTFGCAFRSAGEGLELAGVVKGGSAAKAGLKPGDRVSAIDGAKGPDAMMQAVDAAKLAGRAISLEMADGRLVRMEPGDPV